MMKTLSSMRDIVGSHDTLIGLFERTSESSLGPSRSTQTYRNWRNHNHQKSLENA